MKQITPRKQTLDNNCVSACIAMLLNQEVDEIHGKFHTDYFNHIVTPSEFLSAHGCLVRTPSPEMAGQLHVGHIYLLCVPALNVNGQFHCILLDTRVAHNPVVYDPANTSRRRYVYPGTLTDPVHEFELIAWVVHAIIDYAPALED